MRVGRFDSVSTVRSITAVGGICANATFTNAGEQREGVVASTTRHRKLGGQMNRPGNCLTK